MIIPPLGLGMSFPLPALLLAVAAAAGLVAAGRAARRGRGRRSLLSPAMFCLLALALVLAARDMWSLGR